MVGISVDGPARDRVLKLMEEKDRIESEIRNQTAILEKNNVGMQDNLVDGDGFPRSDIDVFNVRHARHRIICLQNDHKNIMKQIERGLAEVHSDLLGTPHVASQPATSSANGHVDNGHQANGEGRGGQESFAFVSFVDYGSPADLGGLCVDDEVVQFGSVNHSNFSDITQIHSIVSHSVGQRVNVVVKRQQHMVNLTIVPQPWAKPGLLGCHIQRKPN